VKIQTYFLIIAQGTITHERKPRQVGGKDFLFIRRFLLDKVILNRDKVFYSFLRKDLLARTPTIARGTSKQRNKSFSYFYFCVTGKDKREWDGLKHKHGHLKESLLQSLR